MSERERPCPHCGQGPIIHGLLGTFCGNCEWQPQDKVVQSD